MATLDWIVLCTVLLFIVVYGVWKSRGQQNIDAYLLGDQQSRWWMVGLSVMATQASAITFLSTPGQGFADGMRFVQFYFGLPIAMIILCITFIPLYYKMKVYTAYEFLEGRFDLKTRSLAAFLFLLQRGMGAGLTIFAPSIILSAVLGWNLKITNLIMGGLVIIYTVSGGSKAVNQTQKLQMFIIFIGMFAAYFFLLNNLPDQWTLHESLSLAGIHDRLKVMDFSFDLNSRYTIWSGITGGLFLQLAYFGTDQSQVARYLSGRSISESRLGLLFNGLLKIPMQFFILWIGVFVFIFYQFNPAPVFFNQKQLDKVESSAYASELQTLTEEYENNFRDKQVLLTDFKNQLNGDDLQFKQTKDKLQVLLTDEYRIRDSVKSIIRKTDNLAETNDRDYVFLNFILTQLPTGLIGLLLAVIFSAAMSSTSAELNALSSTTTVDIYKRWVNPGRGDYHYLVMSRIFTFGWGLVAIGFALLGNLAENLIQFVNIVGSLFYGTILGIFLVAFYFKRIAGTAVFWAAVISEIIVLAAYFTQDIGYLWFNLIGCLSVILISHIFRYTIDKPANVV